jgi:hypothetical protein
MLTLYHHFHCEAKPSLLQRQRNITIKMINPIDTKYDKFDLLAVVPGHFHKRDIASHCVDPWKRRSLTGADFKRSSFLDQLVEASEETLSGQGSFRGLFKRVKSIVSRRKKKCSM